MGDPERIGEPGATTLESPARQCSECYREADHAEQRGERRPTVQPVRSWMSGGYLYFGALCVSHSEVEHCWRYQQACKAAAGKPDRLAELEQEHVRGLGIRRQQCRCGRALERVPFSLMTTEELREHNAALRLHPCSAQCGRMLVRDVGKCFECRQGGRADANDRGPYSDIDEDRSLFPAGFGP
jgi:hypothetical protein